MAVTLYLKLRKDETKQIALPLLLRIVNGAGSDKEKIAQLQTLDEQNARIHDRAWLSMIVNWVPEKGLPLTETAKWMKLAARVGELDDEREGTFALSDFQAKLVWERMNYAEFKIVRNNPALAGFVLDFLAVTGKSFGGDVDTEVLEDDSYAA